MISKHEAEKHGVLEIQLRIVEAQLDLHIALSPDLDTVVDIDHIREPLRAQVIAAIKTKYENGGWSVSTTRGPSNELMIRVS